jgi:hypothetical protein
MEQDNSRGMRQRSVWRSRQRRIDKRILPGNQWRSTEGSQSWDQHNEIMQTDISWVTEWGIDS